MCTAAVFIYETKTQADNAVFNAWQSCDVLEAKILLIFSMESFINYPYRPIIFQDRPNEQTSEIVITYIPVSCRGL